MKGFFPNIINFKQPITNTFFMKTFTLSIIIACILPLCAAAQSVWLDAAELNKYLAFNPDRNRVELDNSVAPDPVAILTTLEKYCPDAIIREGDMVVLDLELCFEGNPFISMQSYAQKGLPSEFSKGMSAGRDVGYESAPAAQGGSFVTNLADGLAMFLVQRTKEELNAAFFDRLRIVMQKQETFQQLFPATFDLVTVIDKEIYNYNAYLEALRGSFSRDMKTLPIQVRDYAVDARFIKKEKDRILLEDVLSVAQMIVDGTPPIELVAYLSQDAALQMEERRGQVADEKDRKGLTDLAMGLRTLDLVSNSLRLRQTGQTWASPAAIADSLRNMSFAYIYLGLLYKQVGEIAYSDGTALQDVLKAMHGATAVPVSFRNYLVSLARTGTQLDQSIGILKEKIGTDEIVYDDYYRFASLLFHFLGQITNFREQVVLPLKPTGQGLPPDQIASAERKFLVVLRQLYEMEFNVRQNHYISAVNNLAFLLSEVLGDDFTFKKDFLRYANFMASVAEASTSQEVAAAIDMFALPPGSSRLKKQSKFSVSLNSYGGLAYGWENDVNKEVNEALDQKNVLAVSAPLGIGFNFGIPQNSSSISLYTQLMDVGAIFAYRFSDQTERIPAIKFENIVAPGFYAIYGFGNNVPISAGIGAQLGPNLRKIDPSVGLETDKTNAWRFGFILSVDIPIKHFYTQ